MQNPFEPGYGERLRNAFDIRNNMRGVATRFVLGTAMASSVLTFAENSGLDTPVGPVTTLGDEDPSEKEVVVRGEQHFVPGKIASKKEEGPTVNLVFPQRFARDFRAKPLKGSQTRKLDSFVREINTIYDELPSARFTIKIRGKASDESEKDGSKTNPDLEDQSPNNKPLARDRAELTRDYLEDKIRSPKVNYVISGREILLSSNQHGRVQKMAKHRKLSETEFIQIYNDERGKLKLSKKEANDMGRWFDGNRGANVSSNYTRRYKPYIGPCDQVVRLVKEPDQTITEKDPGKNGWDLHIFPFVFFPLPRFKRKPKIESGMREKEYPETPGLLSRLGEKGRIKRLNKRSEKFELEVSKRRREVLRASVRTVKKYDTSYSKGMQKRDKNEIREINKNIRRMRLSKWSKRALGLGVAVLLAPFPWVNKNPERKDIFVAGKCETKEKKYGSTFKIWLNSIPYAVYKAAKSQPDWNKQLKVANNFQTTPDETTHTRKTFTRYVVDRKGRVLDEISFPEQSSTTKSYSR